MISENILFGVAFLTILVVTDLLEKQARTKVDNTAGSLLRILSAAFGSLAVMQSMLLPPATVFTDLVITTTAYALLFGLGSYAIWEMWLELELTGSFYVKLTTLVLALAFVANYFTRFL